MTGQRRGGPLPGVIPGCGSRPEADPRNVQAGGPASGHPSISDAPLEDPIAGDEDQQPDRIAMRGEVRRLMEARIDTLPKAFRTVFMLRAVEELSVEEVASALGLSEATVRTCFFRARSLLREGLSRDVDVALGDAFAFDGARCERVVAGVLARLATAIRRQPRLLLPTQESTQ